MKNLPLIFLSFLVLSCGGSDGDMPDPEPPIQENTAPSIPELASPNNDALCTDNPLDFTWGASTDAEGNAIQYEITVATDQGFTSNLQSHITSDTEANFTLMPSTAYYWRVRAKDNRNNLSDYSTVRAFYTEGEGSSNHLPFATTLISPELSTEIDAGTAVLEWSAGDVDEDPLTYDIYFGTTNPPTLLVENTSSDSHSVNVSAATTYYWKIVVKDDQGGAAVGQIWSFFVK